MDPWVLAPLRVATPKDDEVAKGRMLPSSTRNTAC